MRWVFAIAAAAATVLLAGCPDRKRSGAPRPHVASLSPALTEILFELGAGDHLVGVTQFCALPDGRTRPVVGDLLKADVEALLAVDPDIVLVQGIGTEARDDVFGAVRKVKPDLRTERFRLHGLADLRSAVARIGRILDRQDKADEVLRRFDGKLEAVRRRSAGRARPKVLFAVGFRNPLVAGPDTFIDDMIAVAGGINCGRGINSPLPWRPNVSPEAILSAAPDVLICRADPKDATAARAFFRSLKDLPAAREGRIHVVTSSGWRVPSLHLADLAGELGRLIHPDPPGSGAGSAAKAQAGAAP